MEPFYPGRALGESQPWRMNMNRVEKDNAQVPHVYLVGLERCQTGIQILPKSFRSVTTSLVPVYRLSVDVPTRVAKPLMNTVVDLLQSCLLDGLSEKAAVG